MKGLKAGIILGGIVIMLLTCGTIYNCAERICHNEHLIWQRSVKMAVEPNLPDAVDAVIGNVVHIRNNTGQWQGSGVLIAPDLVLTARHVVEEGEDFSVRTNDRKIHRAERAISSKKYDLGFIKLHERLKCTTKIGDIASCRLGEPLFAIGSPYGDFNFNSVTAGILSSLYRDHDSNVPDWGWSCTIQTDTPAHPGNSGCPVYTLDGKVRGILVGGMSNTIIYCIPAELVANDCQVIQLMFLMAEYRHEIAPEFPTGVYDDYVEHY